MPNWSTIEGTWRQWKEPALVWWGRLTAEEWDEIDGSHEKLLLLLQTKYGWDRGEANTEVETRFGQFGLEPE